MKPSLADLREDYTKSGLAITDVHPSPFTQFKTWMDDAIHAGIIDPNAMTLATADQDGVPSSRIVLLKHFGPDGFCFFTNYTSKKARDLNQNPNAALTIHWKELERQICIRGSVAKTSREESENYFHMRPHASQIGALASRQSHQLESREELVARETALLEKYPEGTTVPLSDFWGGYRLTPTYIEFWQGRPSRLHDRITYTLGENMQWQTTRLSP